MRHGFVDEDLSGLGIALMRLRRDVIGCVVLVVCRDDATRQAPPVDRASLNPGCKVRW